MRKMRLKVGKLFEYMLMHEQQKIVFLFQETKKLVSRIIFLKQEFFYYGE
jgi:hypothetical protein